MEPTAKTHVYIGTFRRTHSQMEEFIDSCSGSVMCPFSHIQSTVQGLWKCWSDGCFDEPVYRTIEEVLKAKVKPLL